MYFGTLSDSPAKWRSPGVANEYPNNTMERAFAKARSGAGTCGLGWPPRWRRAARRGCAARTKLAYGAIRLLTARRVF